jgi:hypothetical protein
LLIVFSINPMLRAADHFHCDPNQSVHRTMNSTLLQRE